MGNHISLRSRTIVILVTLLSIIVMGGLVMVWYTYRLESLFSRIVDINLPSLQAGETLESDLAIQKGFVSYYYMDGNPDWLEQLEMYRNRFKEDIKRVRACTLEGPDNEIVDRIVSEYEKYILAKDEVIALYKDGKREAGTKYHPYVRNLYFKTLQMCENYKDIQFAKINLISTESRIKAKRMRFITFISMSIAIILTVILEVILTMLIIDPVRRLALEINRSNDQEKIGEEVFALGHQAHCLIKDMEKF